MLKKWGPVDLAEWAKTGVRCRALGVVMCLALLVAGGRSADAAVVVVDNFSDGTVGISSSGSLEDDYQTGLSGVLGGSRYAYVQRTSGSGTVSLGVNSFPFFAMAFQISSSAALGGGGLSWGRFDDLNADLSRGGMLFGFQAGGFGADEPGLTGTIQLTVYSDTGTNAVAKPIESFISDPRWLHEEFSGVNFTNVTRLDLDWYGFTQGGADLEFETFDLLDNLPEPATGGLFIMAVGGLFLARRKRQNFSRPPFSGSERRAPGRTSTDRHSDIYTQ